MEKPKQGDQNYYCSMYILHKNNFTVYPLLCVVVFPHNNDSEMCQFGHVWIL